MDVFEFLPRPFRVGNNVFDARGKQQTEQDVPARTPGDLWGPVGTWVKFP